MAHGGVVVAGGDVLDVVAAVFAVLHGVAVEDHARCLRGLAGGVADVEALDAQRSKVFEIDTDGLGQCACAGLLATLLREATHQ